MTPMTIVAGALELPPAQPGQELRVEGIRKTYPGVQALKGVSFSVAKGTIHGLAGQNGAGKSTLIKILSGAEEPDEGQIYLGGQTVRFRSPPEAQSAGVQTIYQELSLVPQLSVAENIFLGQVPQKPHIRVVDWARMQQEASDALARIGFDLDVRKPVGSYSVAEQQAVELAKALRKKARVILLDEPTSTLPPPDVKRLFDVLKSLAAQGETMIYITHRMEELFELCTTISVLRDGRNAATVDTATSEPTDVVSAMIGKELKGSIADIALSGGWAPRLGSGTRGKVLMEVDGLAEDGKVKETSFKLYEGEVLGITGLVGSGQSELVSLLAGARRRSRGVISFAGKTVNFSSPRDAIRLGIGLMPQDRKAHGFVPGMSVADNMAIASFPMFSRLSVLNDSKINQTATAIARRLEMRIFGVSQAMKTLSGGTQQKCILARWLVRSARLLICDEPTRGVDVGAKEEMYELIGNFARSGGTVIVASSEISEAVFCDRVLVMARGSVVAELDHDEIDGHGAAIISHYG
jgi:ribose transport system ATP-binding protein